MQELPAKGELTPYHTFEYIFMPKQIILKLTNSDNTPLSNAQVDVFPLVTKFSPFSIKISKNKSFTGATNENGEFNLGDNKHLFSSNDPLSFWIGKVVFLRITYKDLVRYSAITTSYINTLYFQGNIDIARITLPFMQLITYDPSRPMLTSSKNTVLYSDGTSGVELLQSEDDKEVMDQHLLEHLRLISMPLGNSDSSLKTDSNSSNDTPATQNSGNLYDLNKDGKVNTIDASRFLQKWREREIIDFNSDSITNSIDYSLLQRNFK